MTDIDALLLRRFSDSGDPEAFSEIVKLYAGVVYGACRRIINDSDLAADVSQETFFQLLRNAGDVSGSLGGWLHTVATRKAINIVRKDSTRRAYESEYSSSKLYQAESWDELAPYVDEALGEIDEQLRQVLILHFLEGLTTRQIGENMSFSQATVSRRINTGLESLRSVLKKRGIIVVAVSLSSLMAQNAAQAAPAVLLAELGKMSLAVGGTIAAETVGATGATVTAKTATAAAITAVKAKVVTAVAVVAVGTGAVVTYNHVNKPAAPEPVKPVVTKSVDTGGLDIATPAVHNNRAATEQSWDEFWAELEKEEAAASAKTVAVQSDAYQVETPKENDTTADDKSKTAVTAAQFAIPAAIPAPRAAASSADPNKAAPSGGGGYGGGMMGRRVIRTSSKVRPAAMPSANQ